MKPLSIDEINNLQAENERLKKFDVLYDLTIVVSGALVGTIAGQILLKFLYGFMDALLR
jgi:hypothetical protein